jgi:CheY-like chemotaxis protein
MTAAASKVLIADGNEQIALLSSFLEQEVITPVVVHSGQAALEKIRSKARQYGTPVD